MNKLSTYFSRLAMLAIAGFTISSCTTAVGPGGTNTTTIADSLGANSNSSTSIGLRWTRLSTDVTADTVYVSGGSASITPQIVAAPSSSTIIGGLTEGVVYTFSVHAAGGVSLYPVTWMTARRSAGLITLYETGDNGAGHFSGLKLSTLSAISVAAGAANRTDADLVLALDNTVAGSNLTLVAGSVTAFSGLPAGRNTWISNKSRIVPAPGLDNLYFTGDIRNLIPTTGVDTTNAFDIPDVNYNGGAAVLLVKTADNHFARVEIVPQANGKLYARSGIYGYIQVRVSYQSTVDAAYANRGHAPALTSSTKHAIGRLVIGN